MNEAQVPSALRGEIVFDRSLGIVPDDDWFDREHWRQRTSVLERAGGRAGIAFVQTPIGECALRHYRRGGLVARVSDDRYCWRGAARTRSLREFRLLASLRQHGLPVAAPVAARYVRDRATYRADLMTRRVAPARTVAQWLANDVLDERMAATIGATIARFHAAGVDHADLNAHNILLQSEQFRGDVIDGRADRGSASDSDGGCWLIDFDRGCLRAPRRAWQQANIARLRRSLDKLGARRIVDFEQRFWRPLLASYHGRLAGMAGATTPTAVSP